jgi:hypothetical protein
MPAYCEDKPKKKPSASCAKCRHYVSDEVGYCRRLPPTPVFTGRAAEPTFHPQFTSPFPQVRPDMVCGEFKA